MQSGSAAARGGTIPTPGHDGAISRALPELGLTREKLQADCPIIGIAQTGSDLVPPALCKR